MADEEMDVPQRGYNTEDVRVMAEPPRRRGRRWLWLTLLILFVGPAVVVGLWALVTLNISYSKGDRTGYIQKFSEKGWLCKTWEGELAMTTVPGTAPQLFEFSVRDDSIAQVIRDIVQTREGRVSITYEQHKGVPTDCFGETDYFVTEARAVGTGPAPGAPGAPAPGTATPTAPAAPLPTTP